MRKRVISNLEHAEIKKYIVEMGWVFKSLTQLESEKVNFILNQSY